MMQIFLKKIREKLEKEYGIDGLNKYKNLFSLKQFSIIFAGIFTITVGAYIFLYYDFHQCNTYMQAHPVYLESQQHLLCQMS